LGRWIIGRKGGLGVRESVTKRENLRKTKEKRKKSCGMALEKVCESVSKCESLRLKWGGGRAKGLAELEAAVHMAYLH
jgi:hypothetical protein